LNPGRRLAERHSINGLGDTFGGVIGPIFRIEDKVSTVWMPGKLPKLHHEFAKFFVGASFVDGEYLMDEINELGLGVFGNAFPNGHRFMAP